MALPGARAKPRSIPLLQKVLPQARASLPVITGWSLDRKLDAVGIVLTLIGLLTVLSLLSITNSSVTGGWVAGLRATFGLGMYLFAAGLILTGLWLVLRNFERVPQLSVERMVGFVLLFVNLLAVVHFLAMQGSGAPALELAQQGAGGGYLGALIAGGLEAGLGKGGAAIALLAWLLIALGLSLDITIVEMVRRITPLFGRFQDWLDETIEERRARRAQPNTRLIDFPSTENGSGVSSTGLNAATAQQTPFSPPVVYTRIGVGQQAGVTPNWVLPPADVLDQGGEVSSDDEFDRAARQPDRRDAELFRRSGTRDRDQPRPDHHPVWRRARFRRIARRAHARACGQDHRPGR